MKHTAMLVFIVSLILVLCVVPVNTGHSATALARGGPQDAQSTTGPTPPPGIVRGYPQPSTPHTEVILAGAPAYLWYNGCGPTAAGMVIGYWDGHGFDDLVPGSAATQTGAVDAMISSTGNYDDYCLPIDYYPTMMADKSEPPAGDEHADDSVADLMKTSQSYHGNFYGWSWYSDMAPALQGYVEQVAPHYAATAVDQTWWTNLSWSSYQAEIDAGRPVVFLVDTDGNGGTDHFVTGIGYSDSDGQRLYAVRDTWDTGLHWFPFAQMAPGRPWGIYGATYFDIRGETISHSIYLPFVQRTTGD